jgi:hypothetical protein
VVYCGRVVERDLFDCINASVQFISSFPDLGMDGWMGGWVDDTLKIGKRCNEVRSSEKRLNAMQSDAKRCKVTHCDANDAIQYDAM